MAQARPVSVQSGAQKRRPRRRHAWNERRWHEYEAHTAAPRSHRAAHYPTGADSAHRPSHRPSHPHAHQSERGDRTGDDNQRHERRIPHADSAAIYHPCHSDDQYDWRHRSIPAKRLRVAKKSVARSANHHHHSCIHPRYPCACLRPILHPSRPCGWQPITADSLSRRPNDGCGWRHELDAHGAIRGCWAI